jgi:serine protease AprX
VRLSIILNTLLIYPNPNSGDFTIDFTPVEPNTEVTVQIYDLAGKLIYSKVYTDVTFMHESIQLSETSNGNASGIYLVKVINQEHLFTQKVSITQ